ncbi:STN domain-containing protein [Niabella ginsengisoli]|uniref:Carboxypeptidase-like regulatory domain-containing protein n=1 Tax=Niabella ginsengisoli TaxID=522298 RepID=A0ABS9SH07_9BACT|nr:STN domain-containing protein [Niabella ginsengisoli]MCH5597439.1 carboxypeptidase-like regulatory domain-containing protein [Niabella ginsengisoli]
MKLSVFIVLLTTFQCVANNGLAQDRISIDLKNATIETVLNKIASKSNYNFVYKDDILPNSIKLNVLTKDADIDYVMEKILAGTKLEYKKTAANLITIIEKTGKIDFPPSWVLRGIVLNEKDEPIIGATVAVKGTSKTTSTDITGQFLLEIESAEDSIIISYLGYKTLRIAAGNSKEVTFQLEPDAEAQKMSEVVVVGFGEQKSRLL